MFDKSSTIVTMRGITVVFLLSAFLMLGCTQLVPTQWIPGQPVDKPDQPTDVQKVLTFAKPAVVFIITDISGVVTLPEAEVSADTGSLRPTATTYSYEYGSTFFGSGFIISPDGYVITNAHVVFTDKGIENELLADATEEEFLASVEAYSELTGYMPSDDTLDTLAEMTTDYVHQYGKIDRSQRKISVIMGSSDSGALKQYIANVRKIGDSEIGGLDLALLKLDQDNLPTVKLGDSNKLEAAASIYAVGYPAIITSESGEGGVFDINGITEPTLTAGVMTSRRTTNKGITVIGIDASIKGGNSGGPSFNSKGEVVGVNTFGFGEDETYNFIVPSSLIKDFLEEANVENEQGQVDERYRKGLEYYWDGRYQEAKQELEIVENLYPSHAYVGQYLTLIEEKLTS